MLRQEFKHLNVQLKNYFDETFPANCEVSVFSELSDVCVALHRFCTEYE